MADNYKAIVKVPAWSEHLQTHGQGKVNSNSAAYAKVPLLRRVVNLRCDTLAGLPFVVENAAGDDIGWQYEQSFSELIWKTEAALLFTGAAYWLKLGNRVRSLGAEWINPYTVKVEFTGGEYRFIQEIDGRIVNRWKQNEIVYFKEFNDRDDIQPGPATISTALQSAKLMHYIGAFGESFFEGGAMPVMLLGVEGNPPPEEIKRVETFFKRVATGVKNAFRVIGLRGIIKPQVITPPLEALKMSELTIDAMRQLSWAFGIPQTMLDDAANFATAKEHRLSFYTDTIVPRAAKIAAVINEQFYAGRYTLTFDHQQLDLFQEDESNRAASLQQLTNAGIPLRLAMEILGYDLTDDQWAMLDEAEAQPEPEPLVMQLPRQPEPQPADNLRALHLEQWERKALNRLKSGKPAAVGFESDAIAGLERDKILGALGVCRSESEVKNLFAEIGMSV